MDAWVVAAVGLVAFVYATVGHAGATGYIAVLTLGGLGPEVIRPTALTLNVLVAGIGTLQFARAGHFRLGLFVPLAAASVPAAFLGGAIDPPTVVFEAILGAVLLCAAARVLREPGEGPQAVARSPGPAALGVLGAAIGFVSGLTGVGGGVFLSPALVTLRAAPLRSVAAVSAAFILVNSLAGLAGWIAAGGGWPPVALPAMAAVGVCGAVGAHLGARRLPVRALHVAMALVLAAAAMKLLLPPLMARGW